MIRHFSPALLAGLLWLSPTQAQLFPRGADALKYGAYTGGHSYSYNTAYSYGLSFSPADSWWRDPFAYPAGVLPYRPYGRPITCRVFPNPPTPYISVPGPNGLPILVRPDAVPTQDIIDPRLPPAGPAPVPVLPMPLPILPTSAGLPLKPVPTATEVKSAQIRVVAPAGAQVWVEKQKLADTDMGMLFQTPPFGPGRIQVYSVLARWTEGGREIEQYRVVGVRAGESAQVDFMRR